MEITTLEVFILAAVIPVTLFLFAYLGVTEGDFRLHFAPHKPPRIILPKQRAKAAPRPPNLPPPPERGIDN